MKRALSKLCGIPVENLALMDVYVNRFHREFVDKDDVADIRDNDKVHAYFFHLIVLVLFTDSYLATRCLIRLRLRERVPDKRLRTTKRLNLVRTAMNLFLLVFLPQLL